MKLVFICVLPCAHVSLWFCSFVFASGFPGFPEEGGVHMSECVCVCVCVCVSTVTEGFMTWSRVYLFIFNIYLFGCIES